MNYEDVRNYLLRKRPVWWYKSGKARKVLLDEVYPSNGRLNAWAFFKVLCKGHKVEVEHDLLCFLHKTKEDCETQYYKKNYEDVAKGVDKKLELIQKTIDQKPNSNIRYKKQLGMLKEGE